MSDVLAYLDGIIHRVSVALMPTEFEEITEFLQGNSWSVTKINNNNNTTTSTNHVSSEEKEKDDTARTLRRQNRLYIPHGLTRWHGFMPLAIAANTLTSILSVGGRAALSDFFLNRGFARVLALNFVPSATSGDGGSADVAGASSSSTRGTHAARHECVDAMRAWCESVTDMLKNASPRVKRVRMESGEAAAKPTRKPTVVHRLLVLVRCCSENRKTLSTRAVARRGDPKAKGHTAARRLQHGKDPLHLFLHDIAALTAVYEARLAGSGHRIHMAVLLLPEDQVYGGALLEQRLSEEVGYRFSVRLFMQDDDECSGGAADTLRNSSNREGLSRARRMAEAWEPSLLHCSSSEGTEEGAKKSRDGGLEVDLLKHAHLFFIRPSNLPLCYFLRETLRRFPIIVTSTVLRQWMLAWTARHSLKDVVTAVHAVLMPFTLSERHRAAAATAAAVAINDEERSQRNTDGSNNKQEVNMCTEVHASSKRLRSSYSDSLQDSVDLINSILEASYKWAHSSESNLDSVVMFALLYEDLVHQRGLHLLRMDPTVAALAELYNREMHYQHQHHQELSSSDDDTTVLPAVDRARIALNTLLPRYTASAMLSAEQGTDDNHRSHASMRLPLAMQPANVRIPVSDALQHSALFSVMPPNLSMYELQAAAAATAAKLQEQQQFRLKKGTMVPASSATLHQQDADDTTNSSCISSNNFFHPLIPNSVRVMYLLCARSLDADTAGQRDVPVAHLQQVCQLSDEAMLMALHELQLAGLSSTNMREHTARSLL